MERSSIFLLDTLTQSAIVQTVKTESYCYLEKKAILITLRNKADKTPMRFSQLLKPEFVLLELNTSVDPEIDYTLEKNVLGLKDKVIEELSFLFEKTGRVTNRNKLYVDLFNREKKASTGIGNGVAIPHVRTVQIRELCMVLARSTPGIPFLAIDGEPVHLFIGLICPPYADQHYLKIFKRIAQMLDGTTLLEDIMACETEDEVIRTFLKSAD